ncbi:HDL061Cp [Eremothecium sinecaudum]|uniref:Tafazzin family protein n=1 Tax=Eremothecium sinecaudum TaxID=45286 RepID=A0A109UZ14_9SACH|nr:HDL061Cp [Eremothecium sinecaudum]AMD20683.1 HDL061Cp [Eremothecium sinecaudum]
MSLPDVLTRGDEFLSEYPRQSKLWQWTSHGVCLATVGFSKLVLALGYNVKLNGLENLENAIDRTVNENRGLLTIMNHMSVVDDPFIWGIFPWRMYKDLDQIRWGLGARNVCFQNGFLSNFFSLGKVLATDRFGAGPFQGSIDAAIRLLSPDGTLDLEWSPNNAKRVNDVSAIVAPVKKVHYIPPVRREKPSWVHVFPEGFVLQLQPPHCNSMRYFKWGITRLILESTRPPIVVPMFATGFEKIAPESAANTMVERYLPRNFGANINVTIAKAMDDGIIESFRQEWRQLVEKYYDPKHPTDLSHELRDGKEAQDLRSRLAAVLREHVAKIRHEECEFEKEDSRFKSPAWWKQYTTSEGESDADVQFVGQNWAIRRLQSSFHDSINGDS